jgi:hypothetical protein
MRTSSSAIDSEITTEMAAMPTAPVIAVAADSCSACGTAMATDQRYCIECGQRRGAPRLPTLDAAARLAGPTPRGAAPTTGRLSPAATLAAVIGTLLLAVAIGVFIGRSGNDESSRTATQVVSVIAPPSAAGTAVAAAAAPTTTAATGATTTGAAKKAAATKKAAAPPKKPTPAVVRVGSKGTGPGYQNGKFTGNFFGGGGG